MSGKRRIIWIAVLSAAIIVITIFCVRFFSLNQKNTRILEKNLSQITQTERGRVEDLFTVDYDTLYVFAPYETKSLMQERIGFSARCLEESTSENCLNYLFVKENEAAGYLIGLPGNIGYCINLQPGEYSRQELEQMVYEVKTRQVGNSFGKEKTYQDYNFYFEDEVNHKTEEVIVQSSNAVTEVPVGEKITVDLNGDGVHTVSYALKMEEDESGIVVNAEISDFAIDGRDFTKRLSELGIVMDSPGTDCFYIVDLDASDSYKEIALFDQGPSDDPVTYFLRYQNGDIRLVGSVPDNPVSDTCHFQNDASSRGEVIARFRLSILQTWYAEGYWKVNSAGKLSFEPQAVYYPIGDCEAALLCELPLYTAPDREGEFFMAEPEKVTFTATDDKNWVQLETENGTSGWFYVENYDTIADIGKNAQEVFGSLVIAD